MRRNRHAFTLLELIVMIVILGVAFTTLPMILAVSSDSVRNVSDVRGIYHGVAKMQVVLGKPWDEESVDDFETRGTYYVLHTDESDGPGELLYCDRDKNRSGHYPGLNRRMCENERATAAAFFAEGDFDDIDDFDGDHDIDIEGYRVDTTVSYVRYENGSGITMPTPAVPAGTTSNLKHIRVGVIYPSGNTLAAYHYYAANIGLSRPFVKANR